MSLILLVIALICALVAGLSDFGWLLNADHPLGWVAFSLVFFIASFLVGPAVALRRGE